MSFDRIDRQFRPKETVLGLPSLIKIPTTRTYKLFESEIFDVPGYGLLTVEAVGSRCTCNPAPVGTDQDWLAFVREPMDRLAFCLERDGWIHCGGNEAVAPDYPDMFDAWRRGEDNLILATDKYFHCAFKAASILAQRFNLLNKQDRIDLFHAVRFGKLLD